MRSTQQFSVTLPTEMATWSRPRSPSGDYASESEVIRDGLRALQARDRAVENWLRQDPALTQRAYPTPARRRPMSAARSRPRMTQSWTNQGSRGVLSKRHFSAGSRCAACGHPEADFAARRSPKSRCEKLEIFPHRGTRRDDLRPGLRTIGIRRRVMIAFAVEADAVTIIGIFYGGQDFEAALQIDEE